MRKSSLFFTYVTVLLFLLAIAAAHAIISQKDGMRRIRGEALMVKEFGLTDLCLFTEASYTRHLSQADLNTPFQDSPMSLEHFPSGSFMPPPGRENSNSFAGFIVYVIGVGFIILLKYAGEIFFSPAFPDSDQVEPKTELNRL